MSSGSLPQHASIPRSGSLADVHPDDVLRFCDATHFTGTLGFDAPSGKGVLPILKGFPEVDDSDTLQSALDEFVALREGTYTLHQILPALAGATRDGDLALEGKIVAGGIPALMRYCETGGITGALHLYRDDHQCDAKYASGDLVSITVDREEDAQLDHVFGWNDGRFRIEAKPVFVDTDRVSTPEPQLLKTLEVALAEIMDQRAKRENSSTGASPFRAPSIRQLEGVSFGVERPEGSASTTGAHPRVPSNAPPRRSVQPPTHPVDSTVKVFFVARQGESSPATRHSSGRLGREEVQLDPASVKLTPLTEKAAAETIARASRPDARAEESKMNSWTIAFGVIAAVSTLGALWVLVGLLK